MKKEYLCACCSSFCSPCAVYQGKQYFKCNGSGHVCKVVGQLEVEETMEGRPINKIKKYTCAKDYIPLQEM